MYKEKVRPVLDWLDSLNIEAVSSESMHVAAREALHLAEKTQFTQEVLEKIFSFGGERKFDPGLNINVGGVDFDNPVVIGAGWDKPGHSLLAWYLLGAAGTEFGAVPVMDQYGNPKKRQFVLAPGVPLNRLGFNARGLHYVQKALEQYRNIPAIKGCNLGINKEITAKEAPIMFRVAAKGMAPLVDYLTINVSSPNTPGLRDLQHRSSLVAIVDEVQDGLQEIEVVKPIFIKISDLPFQNIYDVGEVIAEKKLAGMVCINTTTDPDIKAKYGEKWRNEAGGLSGSDPDYRKKVLERVAFAYREFGQVFDIWGVGGINGPQAALETMMAGAKGIQIVSGIRERGTKLPGEIVWNLSDWRQRNGVRNISEIVGVNANKYQAAA